MKARLPSGKNAKQLLDMYYLQARMHLLETAAVLDRIERHPGFEGVSDDPRLVRLQDAARLLVDGQGERAERFQKLFSVE